MLTPIWIEGLRRLGLIRIKADGTIRWPFYICTSWWLWRARWWPASGRPDPYIGLFRNLPGVIKYERGRLLPRRWGFYVLGIEIGDRGD